MKTTMVAICFCAAMALITAIGSVRAEGDQRLQAMSSESTGTGFLPERFAHIPEPAAALLGAIGMMLLLRRRR